MGDMHTGCNKGLALIQFTFILYKQIKSFVIIVFVMTTVMTFIYT